MSGSSVMHMALSSSPFLVLFSYFIYVAHQRPTVLLEALNQKADVTILPLIDMLHTNLLTLICWACLAVYTGLFVRKRRNLMRLYTDEDNVITIIGDVYHEQQRNVCCKLIGRMSYTNLAYVTYKHPEGNFEDGRPRYIQKKIRTYHPYHRENVAILVMKDKPLSGQPKADVERDVASFQSEYAIRNRDKLNQVVIVCLCWIIFCLSSALYMIHQIRVVNDLNIQNAEDEEDLDLAWQYFWVYIGLVVPVVAVGGNILQWILHYRWVIHGGEVTDVLTKHLVPRTLGADENGDYTAMA